MATRRSDVWWTGPHLKMTPLAWFCAGYYLHAVLVGIRDVFVPGRSGTELVFNFAIAVFLCSWALADARRRRQPIPRSQQIWFFAFALLVVPGYVILTRGWKGLGWVSLHALGWLTIANLATYATRFLWAQ